METGQSDFSRKPERRDYLTFKELPSPVRRQSVIRITDLVTNRKPSKSHTKGTLS